MNKKEIIYIFSIIVILGLLILGIWYFFISPTGNDDEMAVDCDAYNFLNINIVQEKTCNDDYYGACNLHEQVESIMSNLASKYNKQLVCPVKTTVWKEGSQIDWEKIFIQIRQDLTQAIEKDNILNQNITLEDDTIFNVREVNQELIPYLEDDKYCEENSDCVIKEVGCVVGSYNPYSNHYFVNGCDVPLTPLRYPENFSSEQIREYETKSNYFTTEQTGCINNQCTEKYILSETKDEF